MLGEFKQSEVLRQRAHQLIPGGAHTYAKGDDQYPALSPGFIVRGEGCRVWDVDGNEFIEYGMGLRAVTLGHAYPSVLEAVRRELSNGSNFTRPAPIEIECADSLLGLVKDADMVKFCKDGSDATSGALKLARAYTRRDYIAICGDHPFFSVDDWFIGTTAIHAGIPEAVRRLTLKFQYNDINSVKKLFAEHPGQISALILEPARTDDPVDGFLDETKRICHENGALIIFDEMICGFRWHAGGGQAYYNVSPDLACFGKAMANGFSVSALTGRREIMRLGGLDHTDRERVFLLSTTHGAETHGLAAAIATMRVYKDEPVVEHLDRMGQLLRDGITDVAHKHGLQRFVKVVGKSCCLFYVALDGNERASQAFRTLLLQELIKRSVLAPSLVVSYSHTEQDVSRTIEAFDGALEIYARALSDGVERYLVGRPSQPVYRPFNTSSHGRNTPEKV
ncbi:MAG: glutamate-1-semialdehyde 2,1-aminomutase [Pseudomonadota bacterium]